MAKIESLDATGHNHYPAPSGLFALRASYLNLELARLFALWSTGTAVTVGVEVYRMELQTGISFVYWEVVVGNANAFIVCLCPSPLILFAFRSVVFLFS